MSLYHKTSIYLISWDKWERGSAISPSCRWGGAWFTHKVISRRYLLRTWKNRSSKQNAMQVRSLIAQLGPERESLIKVVGEAEVKSSAYGQLVLSAGTTDDIDEQLSIAASKAGTFFPFGFTSQSCTLYCWSSLLLAFWMHVLNGQCSHSVKTSHCLYPEERDSYSLQEDCILLLDRHMSAMDV